LLVLLGDATEELLDGSLLVVGVIAELHHLLQQSIKMESKVINVLTWLEGQVLSLLAKCLQRAARSLLMRATAMASQAFLAVHFLESEKYISARWQQ
jgi:hypothetical protein